MEIKTWWERLNCTRNPGAHSGEDVVRDEEIAELRAAIESREQEVLKLHRDLAAEKLRADQGWHRYEAANLRKNELEAERANWAQDAKPFMYAIKCPDGGAHLDEHCVAADEESLYLEVNGLNDSPDAGYSIVPVYLSAKVARQEPIGAANTKDQPQ